MTVSPVEKPVASAAYGFVRFIGGGLAPYAAGRMVLAINIHFPFYIAVGAILAGIVILTTAHGLLSQAERVQAEQVTGSPTAAGEPEGPGPVGALIPVGAGTVEAGTVAARAGARVILAAVDASPVAALVTAQASWKTRPRACRWPERTVLTPCRTGPADQPRALRTGRSLVVKIRPWPWSRATHVPRDCARGRCSTSRNSPPA